jgi:glucan phosphoethanolaminetransferase (alkaline phosphatase superfamily)
MDQTIVGTIRPEYLEAVEAARFTARLNLWLLPLLLAAPLLVLVPLLRRWHWSVSAGLTLIAVVATWYFYYRWSDTSWRTIEALAVTDAELEEAASDTDAVFEPIFLGTLFAVFYPAIWCGIASALRSFNKRFRRSGIPAEPPMPNRVPGSD